MNEKIVLYNELCDRIKRLELRYHLETDWNEQYRIKDEIKHLKARLEKLEAEICTDQSIRSDLTEYIERTEGIVST